MKQPTAIAAIIIVLILGIVCGWLISRSSPGSNTDGEVVSREVFIDTILYYHPVAKDSVVIRYEVATLPIDRSGTELPSKQNDTIINNVLATVATEPQDSARVIIPITQMIYADSTYTAYVSGYRARLDSIFVYPRHEIVTIKKPPNRWSIGIQAGYGYTPKGFQPYIGIGISWRISEF